MADPTQIMTRGAWGPGFWVKFVATGLLLAVVVPVLNLGISPNSFAAVPTKLATFGRVSAGAQKQFTAAGIDVIRFKLGQPEEADEHGRRQVLDGGGRIAATLRGPQTDASLARALAKADGGRV